MQIIETKVFNYDELSPKAQEKARDWYREASADDSFWSEATIDDAKQIGALMGIDISNVWFSGFWSQGDGATFDATFEYNGACYEAVKEYAPLDEKLQLIAQEWEALQDRHKLSGMVKQQGHYNHSQCSRVTAHSTETPYKNDPEETEYSFDTDDSMVRDNPEPGAIATLILRRFMDWIYRQLEAAYEDANSDESVAETIRANEYTFTETGKRFG